MIITAHTAAGRRISIEHTRSPRCGTLAARDPERCVRILEFEAYYRRMRVLRQRIRK